MANAKEIKDAIVVAILDAEESGLIGVKIPIKDANTLADTIYEALEIHDHLGR